MVHAGSHGLDHQVIYPRPDSCAQSGRRERLVVALALNDDMVMPMMAGWDRRYDDRVWTVMPAAVIVEGNGLVPAMMKAIAVFVDDLDLPVVMSVVGCDDNIGLSRRSYGGQSQEECQCRNNHLFHLNVSIS
jgi:hypothetical protein